MKDALIWGTRALKQTYRKEFNHETGEYVRVPNPKRVTATVEFDCNVTEAGQYEDQKIKIYLLNENMVKETDPFKSEVLQRIDNLTAGFLALSKMIEEKFDGGD